MDGRSDEMLCDGRRREEVRSDCRKVQADGRSEVKVGNGRRSE